MDKIQKLHVPLYQIDNELQKTEYPYEIEEKFDIKYDTKTCEACGLKAFVVKEVYANAKIELFNKSAKKERFLRAVPALVDLHFACIECGESHGGIIQDEKFSRLVEKKAAVRKYRKVRKFKK